MSLQPFIHALHDKNQTPAEKFNAFQIFVPYYDQLKTAVLGSRTFTDHQLSEHIFRSTWTQSQGKIIFEKQLFAAHQTLSRIAIKVSALNFKEYEFLLTMLAYDLYEIIAHAELNYRNTRLNFELGSRDEQNAREIFDISRSLLHFGSINIERFYQREVIPVSVFLLRQTIEVYGKRTLGFYRITEPSGNRAKISTQVAWDFIKQESLKSNPRITLRVPVDVVRRVETWTNMYVHTGNIPDIYLIENAIQFIWPLIFPQNSTERNYRNQAVFAGTAIIRNYTSVKRDFELFINGEPQSKLKKKWIKILLFLKLRKRRSKKLVDWMPIERVDATIKDLG